MAQHRHIGRHFDGGLLTDNGSDRADEGFQLH